MDEKNYTRSRRFCLLEGISTSWGGPLLRDHPPPLPPFQCPHSDKTSGNLLPFEFCIHLHTHLDPKSNCCRAMGKSWDTDALAQVTYQAHTPGLHRPHIASISSKFHWLSHAGTSLEVWSELLPQWLDSPRGLHPSACAFDFWTCPQTPLSPSLLKRATIDWAWANDSGDILPIPWKWPENKCKYPPPQ